jgi:hypothetical protein
MNKQRSYGSFLVPFSLGITLGSLLGFVLGSLLTFWLGAEILRRIRIGLRQLAGDDEKPSFDLLLQ